jgi:hypothetical protein
MAASWHWLAWAQRFLGIVAVSSNNNTIGDPMLELRPTCEHCNTALPPDATNARICSFECTFCVACADEVLGNVCPNCGGGFTARPIRPSRNWKNGNFLGNHPASATVKHRPADLAAHAQLAVAVGATPPEKR